eukprot:1538469-Rhodomonas_salina.2
MGERKRGINHTTGYAALTPNHYQPRPPSSSYLSLLRCSLAPSHSSSAAADLQGEHKLGARLVEAPTIVIAAPQPHVISRYCSILSRPLSSGEQNTEDKNSTLAPVVQPIAMRNHRLHRH